MHAVFLSELKRKKEIHPAKERFMSYVLYLLYYSDVAFGGSSILFNILNITRLFIFFSPYNQVRSKFPEDLRDNVY